jgi:hypothetical protein
MPSRDKATETTQPFLLEPRSSFFCFYQTSHVTCDKTYADDVERHFHVNLVNLARTFF